MRALRSRSSRYPTPHSALLSDFAFGMPVRYVMVPAGHRRGLRPLQDAFDRSRLFRRVAGVPGDDTLYERIEAQP